MRLGGKQLYFGAAAWIAMGVAAYGLALRRYALESIPRGGQVSEHRGRVAWSRTPWLGGEIEFGLEGEDRAYFLPREFLTTPQARHDAETLLKQGLRVWFKSADALVLEIDVNTGTPFERKIVTWETSSQLRARMPETVAAEGMRIFFLGLLLIPFSALARWLALRARDALSRRRGSAQARP